MQNVQVQQPAQHVKVGTSWSHHQNVQHVHRRQTVQHVQQMQTNAQRVSQDTIQVEQDVRNVHKRIAMLVIQQLEFVHHVSVDIICLVEHV